MLIPLIVRSTSVRLLRMANLPQAGSLLMFMSRYWKHSLSWKVISRKIYFKSLSFYCWYYEGHTHRAVLRFVFPNNLIQLLEFISLNNHFTSDPCEDKNKWCRIWAHKGFCNLPYCMKFCKSSCSLCDTD